MRKHYIIFMIVIVLICINFKAYAESSDIDYDMSLKFEDETLENMVRYEIDKATGPLSQDDLDSIESLNSEDFELYVNMRM